ncbi:BCCT family transporter [Amphritea sp. 2_MG-2023]|uniref:BCCT family transporter n=1 Tax=Amphritea TaxID=515417 RepID=UPI001C06581A|nr:MULTISPECIES: BCCT family transporter [Amphritea]MBU2967549.1 BCCT family transporter [Amphritea atlantica]MDO6419037.1 BCCT family transporter [Amphritea sp. 2_MG-2023]
MEKNLKIRPYTFYPSLTILGTLSYLALFDNANFFEITSTMHHWLLDNFGWMYLLSAFFLVISCFVVFFSPIGNMRIGGKDAKPILTKWQWSSITLCSSVAIGLLFFASAEPIIDMLYPPKFLGAEPLSNETAVFGLAAVFMHWSLTTYALYSIPALAFALAYYNYKSEFSISSAMFVGSNFELKSTIRELIDAVALIALAAGMITSLGASILMLEGGINALFDTQIGTTALALIAASVIVASSISAASGLHKGIAFLSNWNAKAFIAFSLLVLIFGPTSFIANAGLDSLSMYLSNFVAWSLDTGVVTEDSWPKDWTIFFWANWYAWAPIVAIFLGKISRGYTVKEFLIFNVAIPSVFVTFWCSVFGGYSIYLELTANNVLSNTLIEQGPGAIIWELFRDLPASIFFIGFFLIMSFVSYVTAADSAIDAISGTCVQSSNEQDSEPKSPLIIKLIWGGIIALLACILTLNNGLDGLKLVSTLGGFFGMLIVVCAQVFLLRLCFSKSHKKKILLDTADNLSQKTYKTATVTI